MPESTPGQALELDINSNGRGCCCARTRAPGTATRTAAERLFDIGENHGVKGGVAINTLSADFRIKDPAARLWPQTERLKAASRLGTLTGDDRYWNSALGARARLVAVPGPRRAGSVVRQD
ncbi:MAG: AGE family epimerase/isomerase [Steroidobacteraceae bacterium]